MTRTFSFVLMAVASSMFAFAQTAKVQIIHNSPLPAAASVDVYVNGAKPEALDDFMFRTATPFVDVPANEDIIVTVAEPTSMDVDDKVIATFNLGQLIPDGEYVVFANGILGDGFANPEMMRDINFQLYALAGQQTVENKTLVGLNIFHGATDAPAVDIYADINGDALVPGLDYGQSTGYVELPANRYTLTVTVAGNKEAVAGTFDADISTLGGASAVAFASGFLDVDNQGTDIPGDYTFGIFVALPDGTVLQLPDAPSASVEELPMGMNVFPNPAIETLTINSQTESLHRLALFAANGSQVMNIQVTGNSVEVPVTQLSSGVYVAHISTSEGTFQHTLVIE